MMVAGLVGIPAGVSQADQSVSHPDCMQNDPRLRSLVRFLSEAKSPILHLAPAFIGEADAHRLDWRLLPSLSFIESGGGKSARGNNVFGWANGNHSFSTVREGIHFVAGRLAFSRFYRGKDLDGKLKTYNATPGYSDNVKQVMRQISSE